MSEAIRTVFLRPNSRTSFLSNAYGEKKRELKVTNTSGNGNYSSIF
jgi:hypothetical protein